MFNSEVGGSGTDMRNYGRWNVRSQEDGKDKGTYVTVVNVTG